MLCTCIYLFLVNIGRHSTKSRIWWHVQIADNLNKASNQVADLRTTIINHKSLTIHNNLFAVAYYAEVGVKPYSFNVFI